MTDKPPQTRSECLTALGDALKDNIIFLPEEGQRRLRACYVALVADQLIYEANLRVEGRADEQKKPAYRNNSAARSYMASDDN